MHTPLCAGKTIPIECKGRGCAAPDYKAMYFELFRASVQAAQLLQDAQKRAEQHLLEADPPPIRLEQTEQTDEE